MTDKYVSRFWSKVERRGERECWPWLAGRFKGRNGEPTYGAFYRFGKIHKAHRVASAKLNDGIVLEIRRDPRPSREVAVEFGICKSAVNYARTGKTWGHL